MPAVPVTCSPAIVVITALYRETSACGIDYPFIARLVEFDGIGVDAILTLPGTVASAWKTNLLNEPIQELAIEGNQITCSIGPHEIVTIVFDLAEGRKQVRDLDAKREIWATVHRVGEE
jgi:alpha-mannosidase